MRRHISEAEIEIALQMSLQSGPNDMQVAEYTGIRPRTMRGLCKRFRETGEIVKKSAVHGRPRLLNSLDAMVGAPQYMSLHVSYFHTVPGRSLQISRDLSFLWTLGNFGLPRFGVRPYVYS